MIKIRGPFDSPGAAADYVASVASQGVPFKEYQTRPGRDGRELVFAVYDDPKAAWADEEIMADRERGWIVRRPSIETGLDSKLP